MFALFGGNAAIKYEWQCKDEQVFGLLFGDDNDRSIQVHLNVYGLVSLKSIFQASASFLPKIFEGLTRCALLQVISRCK